MKPFLHKYLRKWTPPADLHRQNAMPHIKSYARFNPSDDGAGELDWAILTSSNLSKAAWGSLQKNKTQLMIRSYELGVMFLPQLKTEDTDATPRLVTVGSKSVDRSGDEPTRLLPLPYGFPLTTYNPRKDEPWVWDLVRESPDIFGGAYIPH
jgi:tyrosyl-DNA phosphodiesterase-1